MLDALERKCWLRGNGDRVAWFVALPPRRKGLDEGNQIGPVLGGQGDPRRHIGVVEASRQGVEEVFVSRQSASGRRAALEGRRNEIARQDIQVWPVFSVAVAAETMAAPAVAIVKLFAGTGVSRVFADVRFSLRRCEHRHSQSSGDSRNQFR